METVDLELGRLISRRASQDRRPDPDEQDERWKMSVAAYNAARIEENRQAWCESTTRGRRPATGPSSSSW